MHLAGAPMVLLLLPAGAGAPMIALFLVVFSWNYKENLGVYYDAPMMQDVGRFS
jgi:hypothetical protein